MAVKKRTSEEIVSLLNGPAQHALVRLHRGEKVILSGDAGSRRVKEARLTMAELGLATETRTPKGRRCALEITAAGTRVVPAILAAQKKAAAHFEAQRIEREREEMLALGGQQMLDALKHTREVMDKAILGGRRPSLGELNDIANTVRTAIITAEGK